jgi:uncharacterized protein YijF (DUF1287 family)
MANRTQKRRWKLKPGCLLLAILIVAGGVVASKLVGVWPENYFTAEDFGIEVIRSQSDRDGDGIDDYTDIMLGARRAVQILPVYKSAYYEGGYPPDNEGVCSDVIWRAFADAGYNLKDMVDADITASVDAYPRTEGRPDPNIDFRRVANLRPFFERNCTSLTLDPADIAEWQPGDIVTFGDNHIGIISDKRTASGRAFLIHHSGVDHPGCEEDALLKDEISGHFRFDIDMSRFPQSTPPKWG